MHLLECEECRLAVGGRLTECGDQEAEPPVASRGAGAGALEAALERAQASALAMAPAVARDLAAIDDLLDEMGGLSTILRNRGEMDL